MNNDKNSLDIDAIYNDINDLYTQLKINKDMVLGIIERVKKLESHVEWQKKLTQRELSNFSQEQGYEDTENPLIKNDKVMESAKYLVEEIELHKEKSLVRYCKICDCNTVIEMNESVDVPDHHWCSMCKKHIPTCSTYTEPYLSPETRAIVEEGIEQARRGEFVEGPDLGKCGKLIDKMDRRDLERKIELILERRCPDYDYHMDVIATVEEIAQLLSESIRSVRDEERDVSKFVDDAWIDVTENDYVCTWCGTEHSFKLEFCSQYCLDEHKKADKDMDGDTGEEEEYDAWVMESVLRKRQEARKEHYKEQEHKYKPWHFSKPSSKPEEKSKPLNWSAQTNHNIHKSSPDPNVIEDWKDKE